MSQPAAERETIQQLRARVDAFYASHNDELNPCLKRDKVILEERERQAKQAEREKEKREAKERAERRQKIKAIEEKLTQEDREAIEWAVRKQKINAAVMASLTHSVKPPPGLHIPDDDA